jgi:PAS domain S-box-containing protein
VHRLRPTFLLGIVLALASGAAAAPLRVGIDLNGEPMTFVDAKGVAGGFAVEIMDAIAKEMNIDVVYVARPWAEMVEEFKAGRIDALANITYTTDRAKFIEFTAPHIVMTGAIFVPKGSRKIKSAVDLRDSRVAVKLGSAPHEYLKVHGWADHIVPAETLRDSLRAVAEGRADAALDARTIGLKNIRDERLTNVELADVALLDFAQRLHIGLHPGDTERLALLNDGLARLHANGTYDKIYDRWIGPLEPTRVRLRQLQPYFLPAAIVLAAIVGTLLWQRRLLVRLARQAEALRLSEERLTLVLEGSDDGFWDWDMRTGHIERSARWASMLGYGLTEIPPTLEGGMALVHPDDRATYDAFRHRLDAGERSRYDIEYRMRAKNGEWRWILDRGKVVARAADGTALRMAGTHTDITDLKRARDEAARQEARFRFIYEHSPVGISWVERGRASTRLVNQAYQRITGVSAADAMDPASYVAATHPEDREPLRQQQEKLDRGEISHFSIEQRFVHHTGETVWALLTMHLFRDPVTGEVQEVGTLVDLSELKRTEHEREKLHSKMLETQKLESLGVLAGGIAHDFNNLLTVILANASFARSEARLADTTSLAQIETAARRAADLCRQMLAYAGQGSFAIEPVDLGEVVDDTLQLLHVSISKKAQLALNLAPDLPPVVADRSQLRQVIMNLVINASEALADASGEIRLTTRLVDSVSRAPGGNFAFDVPPGPCVCLEIADTGHGMDAATIARIFDPFFTTKFAGRGLGLAAVLGIVRAHHGALTVDSAKGRGTTFRLYLPAADAVPEMVASAPAPAAGQHGHGTILVADDEPAVLAAASLVLRSQGYTTVLAENGAAALERFRENPLNFTAALLDLTMPGLDGVEVLRAIRAETPAMPVLVMSGFGEQDVVKRLRGLGEVPILHKPFSHDVLLARIAELTACETVAG